MAQYNDPQYNKEYSVTVKWMGQNPNIMIFANPYITMTCKWTECKIFPNITNIIIWYTVTI